MINVVCQCGVATSVQESVAAEIDACPACGAALRIACGDPTYAGAVVSGRLIVQAGPTLRGQQILLCGPVPIGIGKLPELAVRLPGTLVSRKHCRLVPSGAGAWRLLDSNSRNGSFVNGSRVASHVLSTGDLVDLGEYELRYIDAAGPIARAPTVQSQAARPPSKWTPFDDAPVADPRLRLTPDDNPPSAEPAAADLSLFDPENSPRDLYDVAAAGNNGTLAPTAQGRNTIARTSRVSSAPLGGGIRCKGCDRSYSLGTRVCVECGIDLKTGRPLITAQGIDENALQVYTEGLIRVISYFIAFGLYPIASEAFGVCKPYLVWAIAILTVMTSIGFWAQESGANGYERDAANRLMLHVGRVSSEQVVDIYEAPEIGPTNPLVRQYLAEKERLKGSVPPDDLPAQAYQALPEGARLLDPGDFHAYQLLTNAFLHAGLLHLAGNMLFLLVFGTRVNALLGQVRTAILYPVLAVAASAVYAVSASNEAPHLCWGHRVRSWAWPACT